MSTQRTNWQIHVVANTKQAEASMVSLMKTAKTAEGAFASLGRMPGMVTQQIKTTPRVFDQLTDSVKKGKLNYEQFNKVVKNSEGIIRRQNQLWRANTAAMQHTDGSLGKTTATMQKFGSVQASMLQKTAMLNTATRALSTHIVDVGKNMQWAGRQITVGFTVPFGIAMIGASAAFLKFEEQAVRFRKVFNDELGSTVNEAEKRVTQLANTMARGLGVSRNEVLETAATFAQMGKGVEEIEELTEATTRLSLLGEVPRETATNLLRAYNASEFRDVEGGVNRIVNSLNALENNTSLTVQMMAESLPQIIPIFAQYNLAFGEGEAITATMVESLGNASEAVNALKVGMQRVYDPTKEAIDAFEEFGIDIIEMRDKSDEVGGGGLIGFLSELGEVMEGQIETNTEFAATIGNLFGVRQAGRLATALRGINDDNADFARGMAVSEQSIEQLAATADAESRAITESIGGRLRILKESILIEITQIGQTFLEMAMPFFEKVGEIISRFNDLDDGTKKFIIGLSAAIAAFGGFIMIGGIAVNLAGMFLKTLTMLLPTLGLMTQETLSENSALAAFSNKSDHARISVDRLTTAIQRQTLVMRENSAAASMYGVTGGMIGPAMVPGGSMANTGGSKAPAGKAGKGGAPVRWRGGMGTAGAAMMVGSMVSNNEDTQDMLGKASMVAFIASMTPNLKKSKEALAKGATAASKWGKGLVTGGRAALMAAGKTTLISAAITIAADGAWTLYQNYKKSKEAAEDFQKSVNSVSEAMDKSGMLNMNFSTSGSEQLVEDMGKMSNLAQTVYTQMEATKTAGGMTWAAAAEDFITEALIAGNTLESINAVLEEIEQFTGGTLTVDVDMEDEEAVGERIAEGFLVSIENAMDRLRYQSTIANPDKKWNANDEFEDRAKGAAMEAKRLMLINAQTFWDQSDQFFKNVYGDEDTPGSRNAEILQAIGEQFGVEKDSLDSIQTQTDLMREIAGTLDNIGTMSEGQRDALREMFSGQTMAGLEAQKTDLENERIRAAHELYTFMQTMPLAFEGALEKYSAPDGFARMAEDFKDGLTDGLITELDITPGGVAALENNGSAIWQSVEAIKTLTGSMAGLQAAINNLVNLKAPTQFDPSAGAFNWSTDLNAVREARGREIRAAAEAALAERRQKEAAELAAAQAEAAAAAKEAAQEQLRILNEARSAAAGIVSSLRSGIASKQDGLVSEVMDAFDARSDKVVENLEKERDAEVQTMEDRKDSIDEYLDKQSELQDSLSQQLDLVMAIATGNVDQAAQIQNQMMFQSVGDAADAQKDNLDDQIDKINDKYDTQIQREEEVRTAQRETLEQNLQDLMAHTSASQAEWDKMYAEVVKKAGAAGVDITDSIRDTGKNGFQTAIDEWTVAVTEDARWKKLSEGLAVKFGIVGRELGNVATAIGAALAGNVDLTSIMSLAKQFGVDVDMPSATTPAPAVPGNTQPSSDPEAPKKNYVPGSDGKIRKPGDFFHSGGPIGGGPAKDVPIVAQTGEYMIQRKAAQALGPEILENMNNAHKYHSGGMITSPMSAIATKGATLGFLGGVTNRIKDELAASAGAGSGGNLDSGFTGSTGILKSPDADWTKGSSKYYGGWTYGLAAGIADKTATSLARLSGGQAIVNAYRDEAHNRRVGGSKNSDHRKGKGIDFVNASGPTTKSWVDRMGAWFEKQSGVRWVGRPATDKGGGHDDHVHVSYKHSGGPISLSKGGAIQQDNTLANLHKGEVVLRRPVSQNLEAGIKKMSEGAGNGGNNFTWNIENYGGSPEDARKLARDVETMIDRKYRRGNPTRSIK